MWFLHVLSLLLLSTATFAASLPWHDPHLPGLVAQDGKTLVKGIDWRTPDGHVPIRREVRDLKANYPDIWNVYMLGLRSFQLSEETDPKSYYQIAGIHGRPYKAWEDAQGKSGNPPAGYCTHNGALFGSWHRPYLALYEQELHKHVEDIALRMPSQLIQQYTAAADQFRIPYWDWALGDSGGSVPEVITSPTVDVIGIDGQNQSIPNPLHHFDFHPVLPGDFADKWVNLNTTLRWPTSNAVDAVSQETVFIQNYNDIITMLHNQVSDGYSIASDLNSFSKTYLETAHGWVHNAVGGPDNQAGHMNPIDYSAFDPIFALHHCNVDRLLAIWEAAHPGLDIVPETIDSNMINFWLSQGDTIDTNSDLPPFWKTETTFWKVSEVRDTQIFGYAYPETMNWTFSSADAYGASINSTIARLYSNSARSSLTAGAAGTGAANFNHLLKDNSYTDWNVEIRAARSALKATFIMRFSLVGTFSSDPVTQVGAWHVLMSESHRVAARKVKRTNTLEKQQEGHVSLTSALLTEIAAGHLESLEAVDVVPFLKEKLTWKATMGGTAVPHGELQNITITVSSTQVRIPESADQPLEYSAETTPYPEVTAGKGGGAKV
ncbi:hypothetical protein BDV96DRAFT_655683 [Lophiotrema nucula]|uniref:tyrosinase n=1 Tax=Lophiotrema nucula TaxID=690887 RepID=A0A6A5YDP4_9PLEO|nr:hypothetical protein BDV96DRAFT_655683 [Lophiotrema nucula]